MSQSLPDPKPLEDELNRCVQHFGKPSGQELDKALKQRLEQARQRYLKRQQNLLRNQERDRNKGRDR